jgi:hypothetical protein
VGSDGEVDLSVSVEIADRRQALPECAGVAIEAAVEAATRRAELDVGLDAGGRRARVQVEDVDRAIP